MKWVWVDKNTAPAFAEFRLPFTYTDGRITLKISAEYRYVAYVNGEFVANGQYPDAPFYKVYDEVDITGFARQGENELLVQAFHMGIDGMTVRADVPCVAFEIWCGGECLAGSSAGIDSRRIAGYSALVQTTPQLGYGIGYDFTAEENPWKKSVEVKTDYKEVPRPVLKTKAERELLGIVSAQGEFLKNGGETAAEIVQNCWMRTVLFDELTGVSREKFFKLQSPVTFTGKGGDGVFVVVDLGQESVGFLRFLVNVEEDCKAYLCWGEHLQDLRIRANVGPRHFAYAFQLKKGENSFTEYFRRIGGRYMGLYVEGKSLTVHKIGMLEDEYPLQYPKKDFGDRLLNKIYETGRRTLQLCIHDHYEDCPWREQALYAGDSRNQMKFGYTAFGERRMPKESLRLMALCIENDGLIPLTAPSQINLNIPSFSLWWIVGLYEYVEETGDTEFLAKMLSYAEKIVAAFENRTTDKGLMSFGEARYWNFHEWSDGLDGGEIWRTEDIEPKPDGPLTALAIFAVIRLAKLFKMQNDAEKASKYTEYCNRLINSLDGFYCEEKGLYRSYQDSNQYHAYMQAMVLATGAVTDEKRIKRMCEVLKNPSDYGVVELTLAHFATKYDVLIEYDNGLDFVIDQICEVFGGMLFSGATSYWETAKGEMDFDSAGSLCHGWAAVACYILDKYYQPQRDRKENKAINKGGKK